MKTDEYLEFYYKMSGEIIAHITSLEYQTTMMIAKHFCSPHRDEPRAYAMARIDEVIFVLSENIRSFTTKLQLLDSILKTHYSPFFINHPEFISDLRSMNKYRIKFAHHQVKVPEDIIKGENIQPVEELQNIILVQMNPEASVEANEVPYSINQHQINIKTIHKCFASFKELCYTPPAFIMK